MKNLNFLKSLFKEKNAIWILYGNEGNDKIINKVFKNKVVSKFVLIISKNKTEIIISEMELSNLEIKDNSLKTSTYKNQNDFLEIFEKVLKNFESENPRKIFMNFSKNVEIDFLGHGSFLFLQKSILKVFPKVEFLSAEKFINIFFESKSYEEIYRLKLAAKRALEIIEKSFSEIKIGMNEKEIQKIFHKIFEEKSDWFEKEGIVKEEFAWNKSFCPIVLIGENLEKGAHSAPSKKVLGDKETIYSNFGVKLFFEDGEFWTSDLQRMGFSSEDGKIPEEINKVFKTLYNSIIKGAEAMKPNVKGFEIDKIVRNEILENGYPDYFHATGHAIGEEAHGIGTTITFTELEEKVVENGTYTIEPRIKIKNGGSIEEMIVVRKNGAEFLGERQKELIIIK